MSYNDLVPNSEGKGFPVGDCTLEVNLKRAEVWIERHKKFPEPSNLIAEVGYAKSNDGRDNEVRKMNHAAATWLCQDWDKAAGNEHPYTYTGYLLARAMNKQAHLLPGSDVDLVVELDQMASEHIQHARAFGQNALNGMAYSYPKIYDVHAQLSKLWVKSFAYNKCADIQHAQAGMVLPFMMGLTSRLVGHTPKNFSCMVVKDTEELEKSQFHLLFRADVPLADDVV